VPAFGFLTFALQKVFYRSEHGELRKEPQRVLSTIWPDFTRIIAESIAGPSLLHFDFGILTFDFFSHDLPGISTRYGIAKPSRSWSQPCRV
jgi:hypothetical protein